MLTIAANTYHLSMDNRALKILLKTRQSFAIFLVVKYLKTPYLERDNDMKTQYKCKRCGKIVAVKVPNCPECTSSDGYTKLESIAETKHTTDEFEGNIKVTIAEKEVRVWCCNENGCQFRFKALGKVIKSGNDVLVIAAEKGE